MKKKIILLGPEQREQAKKLIDYLPEDGPLHRVIIEPHEETRSSLANAFYWGPVVTTMAEELGQTKEELHHDHKYKFLVPIYVRDIPSYAEMIEAVKEVAQKDASLAYILRREIVKMTSTTTASVRQFCEFVRDVEHHAQSMNIKLPAKPYKDLV